VAPRDRPDAVSHGDDGEAEGQGDAQLPDVIKPAQHGRAAPEQHQNQRADQFGGELLDHGTLPFPVTA